MVFMEKLQDQPWWKQMIWKPSDKEKGLLEGKCASPTGMEVPDELRQWRGFEFAEVLEQGMGPGLTSTFIDPPSAKEEKDHRLHVRVEMERQSYVLTTESGDSLLLATSQADGLGFDIFVASDGHPRKALGPSFVLKGNASKDQWSLTSVRCEQCESRGTRLCGTRELARMSHYCETVGDGNAFCMDVELPEMREDGSCNVVCTVCSDPDEHIGGTVLTTRRPKWNIRQKTLTLDFRGRCSMASAKNFQLEAENNRSKVTLLFGKIAPSQFVMDYCHPLGMVQAFATALTATHWK
eukprot:TRINITY_DN6760_c1_g3_i1.p1 TRINITY_DN6760_c1_g3~~TRINITY_DN6760_c1_g3_i1.p1  ORF type:complete len:295 (-),score=63.75 TRINITY_DN6760_c1_g3_i1:44-928(-)